MILKFPFMKVNEIRPSKIIANCLVENESSKSVLLKAGLKFQGNKWFEDTQCEDACFELILQYLLALNHSGGQVVSLGITSARIEVI